MTEKLNSSESATTWRSAPTLTATRVTGLPCGVRDRRIQDRPAERQLMHHAGLSATVGRAIARAPRFAWPKTYAR